MPKSNTKLMFRCYKSTTKEFKICLFQLTKGQKKDIKSDSIKPLEFMWKVYQSIMWTLMTQFKKRWRKEVGTDQ